MNDGSIGVFDSGVGGFTVVEAIRRLLPGERIIYLGDTARLPYGTKSPVTIQRYSHNNARFLLDRGVKMLVIACNTASALAIDQLRAFSPVPVVDVISPVCRKVGEVFSENCIGVIGTSSTIRSGAFQSGISLLAPEAEVISCACPLFVPLVEEGMMEHAVTEMLIREYLEPMKSMDIDCLVFGCTHYPLLELPLRKFFGESVEFVLAGVETAKVIKQVLEEKNIMSGGRRGHDQFYLTDFSETFQKAISLFLREDSEYIEHVDLKMAGGTDSI